MTWRVEGMFCPHCEQTILGALSGLPGLSNVRVSYRASTLSADWDRALLSEKQLADILANHGYTLKAPRSPLRDALGFAGGVAALILLFFAVDRSPLGTWIAAFPTAKAGMSLGALFLVGLMTSLHCVAMCGGINVASAGNTRRSAILYNLGRVVSYTQSSARWAARSACPPPCKPAFSFLPPPLCWPWRSICWAASVFCHRSACQAGCPACFAAVQPSSSVWLTG